MATQTFSDRNLLYEYLSNLDYPSIKRLCSSNKDIYLTCSTNPMIGKLIRQRRVEYRTDKLVDDENILYKVAEASKLGDVEVVDELIRRGYDPSVNNNHALIEASNKGDLAVVNRLLQDNRVNSRLNSGTNYDSVIRVASRNGHVLVVDRLLQNEHVRPRTLHDKAFIVAIENGQLSVVDRLLQDKRIDPRTNNNEAILWAIQRGHLSIVERLLQDPPVGFPANVLIQVLIIMPQSLRRIIITIYQLYVFFFKMKGLKTV